MKLPAALRHPSLVSLLLVLLALTSRLPQLLSPALLLDGDEAVLGMMARHLAAGGPWPVYFYGQHYGLSLFEAAAGALLFALFGAQAPVLKLAMLLLWTGGLLAYHRALRALLPASPGLVLLLAVTLCLCPAWAVWSMKARGGYITAFCLSGLLCWLLFGAPRLTGLARPLLAGALFATIGAAQALWLPGLAPLLAWAWWQGRERRAAVALLAGAALAAAAWSLAGGGATAAIWTPPVGNGPASPWTASLALPSRLFDHLCGAWYLHRVLPCPPGARLAALILWLLVVLGLGGLALAGWQRRASGLALALGLGLLLSLLATLPVSHYGPRYLLPVTPLLLLLLASTCARAGHARWLRAALLGCCVGGAAGLWQFRSFSFQPGGAAAVQALVGALQAHGVRAVFSHDGLLQWQIMFYSEGQIVGRSTSRDDRYPPYVAAANAWLHRDPAAVAELGLLDEFGAAAPDAKRVLRIAGVYGVVLGVDARELRERGFAF